jgi:hypothetical protein
VRGPSFFSTHRQRLGSACPPDRSPLPLRVLTRRSVHNMGDAGMILFGPIGREVLSLGTIIFAVFATGGQLLAGQIALGALSNGKLCLMLYTGIFAIPTLICALPRTLDRLSWLSVPSVISIIIAGIVGMVGAGVNFPVANISNAVSTDFVTAFISVTNPVFSYAGHFMFFILISEMKHPTVSSLRVFCHIRYRFSWHHISHEHIHILSLRIYLLYFMLQR